MYIAVKQALGLNNSVYPHKVVAVISVLTGVIAESFWTMVALTWRFPVPFREFMGIEPWATFTIVFNYIFSCNVFLKSLGKLRRYLPIVGAQLVLFYLSLGLSLEFVAVPTWAQVVIILLSPFFKVAIKCFLWQYSRKLDDVSMDVTICMVEISGSLYQTVCMQFTNSNLLGSLIMVMGFVQAVVEIRAYLKHDYMGDSKSTLQTAVKIVESAAISANEGRSPRSEDSPRTERGLIARQSTYQEHRLSSECIQRVLQAKPAEKHSSSSWWKKSRMRSSSGSKTFATSTSRSSVDSSGQATGNSVVLQRKMIQKNKSRRLLDLQKISPEEIAGI